MIEDLIIDETLLKRETTIDLADMRVMTINDFTSLQPLSSQWNTFSSHLHTPLLSYDWIAASAKAFYPSHDLSIFAAHQDHNLAAIAPLAFVQRRGIRQLELVGSSILHEPGGLLYTDCKSLEFLLRKIFQTKIPLFISRVPRYSAEDILLNRLSNELNLFVITRESATPWIPIETSWNVFESGMSSSRRSSMRRLRKRIQTLGNVQFEIITPAPSQVDSLMHEIFSVEASSWRGRRGTAILTKTETKNFFSLYAHSAARSGVLRLGFLRVNNEPIAVMIGVEYARRFWTLKVGFKESWGHYSPGMLLFHHSIQWAFERGLEGYEFLGTDEDWIHIWASQSHPYVSYWIYPMSMKGIIRFGNDMAMIASHKIRSMSFNKRLK